MTKSFFVGLNLFIIVLLLCSIIFFQGVIPLIAIYMGMLLVIIINGIIGYKYNQKWTTIPFSILLIILVLILIGIEIINLWN